MLNTITEFLVEKNVDKDLLNGISYICPGGSHVSGTNDETSDYDFRGIVVLNEDYLMGLKSFEHTKLVSGKGQINLKDDLDVELFSTRKFVNEAFHGETVPIEMLYVNQDLSLLKNEIINPLIDNRDLFLSKTIVFKYLSMIKGNVKKMSLPKENMRRADNIERIEKYGFETKCGMKSVQLLRLCVELLRDKEFNLYRKDKDYLLSIKQGQVPYDDVLKEVNQLQDEVESLLKSSLLPKKPDFDTVNSFYKEYNRKLYKHLNIL